MCSADSVVNPNHSNLVNLEFETLANIDTSPSGNINTDLVEHTLVNQYLNEVDSQDQCSYDNHVTGRNDPFTLIEERRSTWPDIAVDIHNLSSTYNQVRATGLPNSLSAKVPLTSSLRLDNWRAYAREYGLDEWIVNMLAFGFPLQYTGTVPRPYLARNHSSANQYPEQVRKFIQKELQEGALAGPFTQHPFPNSHYVNPLMTRAKNESNDRRIIVDLAFPEGNGINAHVRKNCVFGELQSHVLPSTQDAVRMAKLLDMNVLVAVIDIERAYRNYRSDPIDWPLLVISFDDQYYIDLGLPFGARLSSLYVQRIANFIVKILTSKGILCAMYLDDLFLVCHNKADVHKQFGQAMAIVRSLGLPINYKKLISPTTQAIWLGVYFNFDVHTISIPRKKVDELLTVIDHIQSCQSITYKQTQSIVGRIAHLARVIPAARIFMARILDQLRASDRITVYINHAILADLKWFKTYFLAHNATSLIDLSPPALVIEADSSMVAGGAWTDGRYYIYNYPPGVSASHNICQLEALNYLVAIRAFVSKTYKGRTIELLGDNSGAISALATGRAIDSTLAAVSRALWFHCATRDIKIKFTHRPGVTIYGADALSRAPLGDTERGRADRFINDQGLQPVRVYPAFINYSKYL